MLLPIILYSKTQEILSRHLTPNLPIVFLNESPLQQVKMELGTKKIHSSTKKFNQVMNECQIAFTIVTTT